MVTLEYYGVGLPQLWHFIEHLGVNLAMTANYTVSGLHPDELFKLEKGRVVRGINIFCQPFHLAL